MRQDISRDADRYQKLDELRSRTNLTRNQLGFWLAQTVDPADTSPNMGQFYVLDYAVDPQLFRSAFAGMLATCDALRATFTDDSGTPKQTFNQDFEFELPVHDFTDRPDALQSAKSWALRRIGKPFDVAERCFDSALLKIGAERWAWYLCVHHIVIDGYSMNLIFRRVEGLYEAKVGAGTSVQHELPQYEQYVAQESAYRQSGTVLRDSRYWKQRSPAEPRNLQAYGNRRTVQSTTCERQDLRLERAVSSMLAEGVRSACGQSISIDTDFLVSQLTLLSAFVALVEEEGEITIGTPFHNRASRSQHATVGLLMEVAPLTVDVRFSDSFNDIARKWKAEVMRSIRHYRYGSINPPRSRTYDVMLNLVRCDTMSFCGRPVDATWISSGRWNEAVTLQVQQSNDEADDRYYLDLDTEIFPKPWRDLAVSHMQNLAGAMARAPGEPISRLDISTEFESGLRLEHLCNEEGQVERHDSIMQQFAEVLAKHPDRIALIDGDRRLTYREIDEAGERIAWLLEKNGTLAGTHVGMSIERSAESVIAILGILKSGASYVPVDRNYPRERIRSMLQDTAMRLLVSDSDSNGEFSPFTSLTVLGPADVATAQPHDDWRSDGWRKVSADACAYVNFTSGSTGQPKGVAVPHRGVLRVAGNPDYLRLDSDVSILHMSTISFDAATFEIWGALLGGGSITILREKIPSISAVRRCIEAGRVNTIFVTTSVFNAFVDEDISVFDGMSQILTGGEVASHEHIRRLRERLPRAKLLNVYGPTECTTFTTSFPVPEADRIPKPVPIGRPIDRTSTLVLDPDYNEVPLGTIGTLFVAGDGVAIGYLARPGLTAEKFVVPGHGAARGRRLYDTGDRVRLLPGGDLEFVGRNDNQVKVRGMRIEIDEVERTLAGIHGVRSSIVALHRVSDADSGLAAYVTLEDTALTSADIRAGLLQQLPASHVPRWIVLLDEMPIGSTGKIARKALPAPTDSDEQAEPSTGPRDELDSKLLSIWSEVLQVTVAGIDQNFFEMGGDSVVAIRMAARLSAFDAAIDAKDIFQSESVRGLAALIRGRIDESQSGTSSTPDDADKIVSSIDEADLDALFTELET